MQHIQAVIGTVGIPACGKSTWTKRFMECWPDKYVQVERDIIRADTFTSTGNIWDYKFSKGKESMVTSLQRDQIRDALSIGLSVIVSDTNLNQGSRDMVERVSAEYGITVQWHEIDYEFHQALKWNDKRPNRVPDSVMIRMERNMRLYQDKYVQTEAARAIEWGTMDSCVIMDIDGTLANMKGVRGPFEWDKVHLDKPIKFVVDYAKHIYHDTDHDLILFSGRDGICRALTEGWFQENKVRHNGLFMRAAGSNVNDSIVKEGLFDKAIKDRYHVDHIVDDRKQVCMKWESMGFRVMNVGGFTADF